MDPDPKLDPDPYWPPTSSSGSGSGSVKNEYGSITLQFYEFHGDFDRDNDDKNERPYSRENSDYQSVLWIQIRMRIRRIRMFLGLLDPDPDPSIIKQK